MYSETINWHELPQDGLPDTSLPLLAKLSTDNLLAVISALFDDGRWIAIETGCVIDKPVLAWADMPEGY